MKTTLNPIFAGLFAILMVATSCADFDITKRKYRPGFHVDSGSRREQAKPTEKKHLDKAERAQAGQTSSDGPNHYAHADDLHNATASVAPTTPAKPAKQSLGEMVQSDISWFKNTLFNRAVVRSEVKKLTNKTPIVGRNNWLAWACFGAGIGAVAFGAVGVVLAILIANPIWVLAVLLGIAAIVFGFIHKNQAAGGEQWRRIGFLLGWIGLGLGIVGMVIYFIWIAKALGGVL